MKMTLRVLRPACLNSLMKSFSNMRLQRMTNISTMRNSTIKRNIPPLSPMRRRHTNMMETCSKHSFTTCRKTSSKVVRLRCMMTPMTDWLMTMEILAIIIVMRGV